MSWASHFASAPRAEGQGDDEESWGTLLPWMELGQQEGKEELGMVHQAAVGKCRQLVQGVVVTVHGTGPSEGGAGVDGGERNLSTG